MRFTHYELQYYQAVVDFLIEINQSDNKHINWNWARFEWMHEHPETNKELLPYIGLWWEENKVVGACLFDMYFGEAFCGALPKYLHILKDIYEYAYDNLKDENGLGVSINIDNKKEIQLAESLGYKISDNSETILKIDLSNDISYSLPNGLKIISYDPKDHLSEFQWVLYQGFDHGDDYEEFKKEEITETGRDKYREHFNPYLSVAVINENGEAVSYCSLWYLPQTDYAYIEPVCVIPSYRKLGLGKAMIYECLKRVKEIGAKKAYVISDQEFYYKIGFKEETLFKFYWKK